MAADFWKGAGGPIVSAGLGLLSAPFEIMSQRRQQDIMRSGLEAQLRAQNAALETNAMLSREGLYGQLGQALGAQNFSQIAADLDFGRQQRAKELELGPFAEKQMAFDVDKARREFGLAGSTEVREARQRENREALKRSLFEKGNLAEWTGMFGRKKPVDVSTLVV
jgi:hypothetical protein